MAYRTHCLVCAGTGCVSCGSFQFGQALEAEVKRRGLADEVQVVRTGCQGFCALGPVVVVQPDGVFYCGLKVSDVPHLVEEHFLKGRPVKKFMYSPPTEKAPIPALRDIPFFSKQMLVVLRNRGMIDPEKIDDYIARDGYMALAKALTEMSRRTDHPGDQALRAARARRRRLPDRRQVGDLPARRHAARRRPDHRLQRRRRGPRRLHGSLHHGGRSALGHRRHDHRRLSRLAPSRAIVYVRHEYPLAGDRLLEGARAGPGVRPAGQEHPGHRLRLRHRDRPGGRRLRLRRVHRADGVARGQASASRGPSTSTPSNSGLWDRPTNLNNVETWANVPLIINRGATWFAAIGTATYENPERQQRHQGLLPGRQGQQHRPGRGADGHHPPEIIYDIGGGIPKRQEVQGRPDRRPVGRLPAGRMLDLPVDFDSLTEAGSMMGSGGMIVMDDDDLHGGRRPLLHQLPHRGVLRQVRAVPRRAAARLQDDPDPDHARAGARGRHRRCSRRSVRSCRTAACARWARRRPTRCCRRSATSGDEYEAHIQEHSARPACART